MQEKFYENSKNFQSIDANEIIDRLKKYYKLKRDNDLADFLGIASSSLSTWRHRNTLGYEIIMAKCKEIDYNWLFGSQNETGKQIKEIQETYDTKSIELENLKNELKKIDVDDKQNSTEVEILKERIAHQDAEISFLREQLKSTNDLMKRLINPSSA